MAVSEVNLGATFDVHMNIKDNGMVYTVSECMHKNTIYKITKYLVRAVRGPLTISVG